MHGEYAWGKPAEAFAAMPGKGRPEDANRAQARACTNRRAVDPDQGPTCGPPLRWAPMSHPSIFAIAADAPPAVRLARRHALVRLSLAWLAMMQVMMLAWPGYVRDAASAQSLPTLDWAIVLMNHASLALTLPVVAYSAWPIWRGAWTDLRRGRVGMDL